VALISGLAGFSFSRLSPDAGAEMSGHQAVKRKIPSSGMGDGSESQEPR
jgi:hypothetical protein